MSSSRSLSAVCCRSSRCWLPVVLTHHRRPRDPAGRGVATTSSLPIDQHGLTAGAGRPASTTQTKRNRLSGADAALPSTSSATRRAAGTPRARPMLRTRHASAAGLVRPGADGGVGGDEAFFHAAPARRRCSRRARHAMTRTPLTSRIVRASSRPRSMATPGAGRVRPPRPDMQEDRQECGSLQGPTARRAASTPRTRRLAHPPRSGFGPADEGRGDPDVGVGGVQRRATRARRVGEAATVGRLARDASRRGRGGPSRPRGRESRRIGQRGEHADQRSGRFARLRWPRRPASVDEDRAAPTCAHSINRDHPLATRLVDARGFAASVGERG